MKVKFVRTEVLTRVEVYHTDEIDTNDLDLEFEEDEDPNDEFYILQALERSGKIHDLEFGYLIKDKDIPQEMDFDVIVIDDDSDDKSEKSSDD